MQCIPLKDADFFSKMRYSFENFMFKNIASRWRNGGTSFTQLWDIARWTNFAGGSV